MRTKKAMYNFLTYFLLQIISNVTGFILPVMVIQHYGSVVNGIIAVVKQFMVFFNLIETGVGMAAIQLLFNPLANREAMKINQILSASRRFYHRTGAWLALIVTLFAIVYPSLVHGSLSKVYMTALILVVLGAGVAEYLLMGTYRVLLTADQKSYVVSLVQSVGLIANNMIAITLITLDSSILIVQLIASAVYVSRVSILAFYVKRNYKDLNIKVNATMDVIPTRWDTFMQQIASMAIFNMPMIVLSMFSDFKAVSLYAVYNTVFGAVSMLILSFSSGIMSGFGQLIALKDKRQLQQAYNMYEYIYYIIMIWGYTCSVLLIMPFVRLYTAKLHDPAYVDPLLAMMFVAVGLLNHIREPQYTIVIAAGHYKETRMRMLVEACINVVASLVFVMFFGIYGVLLGGICSFLFRAIDLIHYGNRVVLKKSPYHSVRRLVVNIIAAACIVGGGGRFIENSSNWIEWIFESIIVAIVVMSVFIVCNVVAEPASAKELTSRIKRLIGKT
ncbi:lipopolysaccharide biosynthesis protein [Paenibacillus hexagrammi]|uniref:Polysaccharide biosynthesis C-terminal domain-containing protein n=1 Tax=Paenibacillus hexagrammi TaxID=2908839 RepID=A0ABY3SH15_9BACL|nr:polysaccharide biosynthesis C-terminal domain-containing protein [Paenibacillus sp. YPD9-1]UJF32788.1 polysaccharide biosynthesis C-terminal domain-containing protein [Paenibacillus sp. YPD9-1]